MTREPITTQGHASTWLWRWVCDRIGCNTTHPAVVARDALPSIADMQRDGWFIAKVWGDRCPRCVAAGLTHNVDPWVDSPNPPRGLLT